MLNAMPLNIMIEQIRSIIRKEAPEITRKTVRDSLKNDPRYRKEITDIMKAEMNNVANRTAQTLGAVQTLVDNATAPSNEVYGKVSLKGAPEHSNASLYKRMKNKIIYGVNTDKGSTLTNNGKTKSL